MASLKCYGVFFLVLYVLTFWNVATLYTCLNQTISVRSVLIYNSDSFKVFPGNDAPDFPQWKQSLNQKTGFTQVCDLEEIADYIKVALLYSMINCVTFFFGGYGMLVCVVKGRWAYLLAKKCFPHFSSLVRMLGASLVLTVCIWLLSLAVIILLLRECFTMWPTSGGARTRNEDESSRHVWAELSFTDATYCELTSSRGANH